MIILRASATAAIVVGLHVAMAPVAFYDYSNNDVPHQHPCGHCKVRLTGVDCFDLGEPVAHRGIYVMCQHCEVLCG